MVRCACSNLRSSASRPPPYRACSATARLPGDRSPKRASASFKSASSSTLPRSEEHTSELQSLMRISYAVFCLKKKTTQKYLLHSEYTNTNNNDKHRRKHTNNTET